MTKKAITQLSYEIVRHAINVHKELGQGLLESIYEKCLKYELESNGYYVQQQIHVPVIYDELELSTDLRLDLLVEDWIIVELKAVEVVHPVHEAKLLSYMKLLKKPQGFVSLRNFGQVII